MKRIIQVFKTIIVPPIIIICSPILLIGLIVSAIIVIWEIN